MRLHYETTLFIVFLILGVLFGIIFDFFRALRKVKKRKDIVVNIQDIIYFLIIGIILTVFIYVYMKEQLRIYLLLSIILGIVLYMSIVGNKVVKIFIAIIKGHNNFWAFIFLPFSLFRHIFAKQVKFFKNIADKCCKRILYVINFIYHKVNDIKKVKVKQKR